MSLPINNTKKSMQPRKSLIAAFQELKNEGKIDDNTLDYFITKINEAGELNLSMNNVLEREKKAKIQLMKTKEYQDKLKAAKMKKVIKALQEQNLDETKGALELILKQVGNELPSDVIKQLSM